MQFFFFENWKLIYLEGLKTYLTHISIHKHTCYFYEWHVKILFNKHNILYIFYQNKKQKIMITLIKREWEWVEWTKIWSIDLALHDDTFLA